MTNNTARNTAARNTSKLIAGLTPMGRQLMLNIGQGRYSFFDDGIVAESGIWHENLTDESAGRDKLPKSATGVANVIDKLAKDKLLTSSDLGADGVWVELTKAGAAVARELAASEPVAKKRARAAEQPTNRVVVVSVPASGVVPLPKSERGRNGTTKNGKTPAKKTGNPQTDRQLAAKKTAAPATVTPESDMSAELASMTPAKKSAAKKTAAPAKKTASKKPAAKKSWATKGLMIVAARKSRVSGTLVWLVNAAAKDSTIKPDAATGMTWARRCVDHDHNDFQASRSAAWLGASDPTGWCPKCKSAATKSAKKTTAPVSTGKLAAALGAKLVPAKKTPAKRVAKKSPAKRSTVHIPID